MSPAARSLALLRRDGWTCATVERWLPYANVRKDLFGIGDVLAVHPGRREFLLVQATSVDHVAHRVAKARQCVELRAWLAAGGLFQVHGWVKRDGRWHVRKVQLVAEDLAALDVQSLPRRRRLKRGERQKQLFE